MTNRGASADIESPSARTLDVSVKKRFHLVIATVLAVLLGMFFIGKTGIDTLSAVRAYVAGLGLWAEAQTEAAYKLERYIDTGDEAAFDDYLRNLAVPLRLETARQELESPDPDMDVLRRGFTDAGVPRADVDGMVWLFRRFESVGYIEELTDIWARGDAKTAEMRALGQRIRARIQAGDVSPEEIRSLKAEVGRVHRELDALVSEFSATLGDAARWVKGLLFTVLISFTLFGAVVSGVGLVLVTRTGTRLQRLNLDLAARNRQRAGQNVLLEHLQGSQRLEAMLDQVLAYLTDFVGAQVGAVYVREGQNVLRLTASHGIGEPDGLPAEIATGQGVIGQAARDCTSQLLEDVPVDHMKISTALTDGQPHHVFVLPLVFGGETKAVVELGGVRAFEPSDLEFLEAVASDIALAVQTFRGRDRVDALLAETQQQAEELEAQQEELRQTNEELEAQAAALEESQTELEELNAVLEEKTEAVQAERAKVEEKNADLEAARQRLVEKAKELETTSRYKSEFLANMSHELRTPLNSIILLSNLLSDNKEGTLTEKQVEFAETIHSSGSDLLDLINEVLDLSKVEAGQMELAIEEVELKSFLSVLERSFQQAAREKGLSFSVEIGDEVPSRIQTDERRLGQILKNLLSNGIKFTREGRVELRVSSPDPAGAPYRGKALPGEPCVAFSVTDTGIGIPEDQLPLVFEAFHQAEGSTDRKYGGTGLGLSISKELTDLLGGEVFVESEVGEGSRFTVVLPARLDATSADPAVAPDNLSPAEPNTVPEPAAAVSDEPDDTSTVPEVSLPEPYIEDDRRGLEPDDRSILIVEDDQNFARILLDLARERGFMGIVAEEGRTALQLADHYRPSAVLLDIGLPDIDGMSFMERLKDNLSTRHIPIHVISAAERRPEALRKGAVGFLRKPTNVTQLKEAFDRIERLLSRPVRRLLIAAGDDALRHEIEGLIGAEDVEITAVASSGEALDRLSAVRFDCMLVVADLPDMDALELLKQVRSDSESPELPAVAIVDEGLPPEDKAALERYADSIVAKDGHYPERVLDETALFLHRVEKDLPEDKRRMLRSLHDQEAILRGKTVLIVDDDMRNTFALSSILEEKDMQTMMAKNGREALDQLEEHSADVDLVLMDIMMPEMDGYEAMRRIRANPGLRKLPVIALTAKAMRGDRAKCIEAGASDYLAKPVDTDRLLSMLRVWLYQ